MKFKGNLHKDYIDLGDGIVLEGRYGASTMVVATLHAGYRLIRDYNLSEIDYYVLFNQVDYIFKYYDIPVQK